MARAAGWIGIAAAGAAMLLLTWGSWPHVIVDFGRELYVPWRLADPGANEVLFRDIAWFNGPLSPYWNALVFRVFGASLRALVLVNLVLVGATTVLLTSLVARIADAAAAVTTAAVFVTVFAFTRFDPIGNDSYLAPYSHEVTHGLLLSLVALLVFAGRRRSGRQAAIGSGLALGLVVLTKAELSLALGAALILGWALEARAPSRRPAAALFLISALVPMTAATGLLALAMPLREAATAALGSWPSLLLTDVTSLHFYRATLGTLGLGANLSAAAGWAAGQIAFAAAIAAAAVAWGRSAGKRGPGGGTSAAGTPAAGSVSLLFAFGAAFLAVVVLPVSWPDAFRSLPLFATVWLCAALARPRTRGADPLLLAVVLLFADVLLAKTFLRVRLDQYGFALAMPATALAIVALVTWLPRRVAALRGDAGVARAGALGAIAAVALSLVLIADGNQSGRREPVGHGPDAFRAGVEGPVVRAALEEIERRLEPDDTLAVLPEGVMLNYLARRRNPTGVVNFMPPELAMFGEDRILRAFRAHAPDYVAIVHKDTREYGVGFFGDARDGYGQALHAFVMDGYRRVARFGDPPLREGSRFGIDLLERRARTGAPESRGSTGSMR